jgi:hypothetical protein
MNNYEYFFRVVKQICAESNFNIDNIKSMFKLQKHNWHNILYVVIVNDCGLNEEGLRYSGLIKTTKKPITFDYMIVSDFNHDLYDTKNKYWHESIDMDEIRRYDNLSSFF